jgi:hypothetical protein
MVEAVNVVINVWLPCKAVSVLTGSTTVGICKKKFISTETCFFVANSRNNVLLVQT